eukprot:CAMPEP_0203955112 /NCGR_PEP_ID=MMETSP0359-20131031/87866_1 /ASSEMBLY_ACC=CAM_ASM_000338 /TAXON_ID=268821 /ORGANISM="Scrippsiella Hangoei, Strain SHTV-5" /LENGTH=54 /DNA_ID=CAMNT_0050888699 /DNA_START=12 /DNA_END=173 /DNA_ORIENTATION=-
MAPARMPGGRRTEGSVEQALQLPMNSLTGPIQQGKTSNDRRKGQTPLAPASSNK